MNEIRFEHRLAHSLNLRIVQGDLTAERVDAIVNPANSHLAHGGGVAGAIVRHGGAVIQNESDAIVSERGPIPTGNAAITTAGALAAKFVIHTVGPRWHEEPSEAEADTKLASAIRSALELGEAHGVESISIPAVSSGIFGFPKSRCAQVMLDAIERYIKSNPHLILQEIRICNIDNETCTLFEDEARRRYDE